MVYPITAHCMEHPARRGRRLRRRGHDHPGPDRLRDDARRRERAALGPASGRGGERGFRRWIGVLAHGERRQQPAVALDDDGRRAIRRRLPAHELERVDSALAFSRERARGRRSDADLLDGARLDARPGQLPHGRRSGAVGGRPKRRVARGERLFVGDASLVPRTLSVNPSLTIMALATRLAEHLDADPEGYLGSKTAGAAAAA